MGRYRSFERSGDSYLEGLDERKTGNLVLEYIASSLGMLFLSGFIGSSAYIIYPFLSNSDSRISNVEVRVDVDKDNYFDRKVRDYKVNSYDTEMTSKKL